MNDIIHCGSRALLGQYIAAKELILSEILPHIVNGKCTDNLIVSIKSSAHLSASYVINITSTGEPQLTEIALEALLDLTLTYRLNEKNNIVGFFY